MAYDAPSHASLTDSHRSRAGRHPSGGLLSRACPSVAGKNFADSLASHVNVSFYRYGASVGCRRTSNEGVTDVCTVQAVLPGPGF